MTQFLAYAKIIIMKLKQRVKKHLQGIKNKEYYRVWEKYKAERSMEELADILNCPLPSFYRIIQKEHEKRN